MAEEGYRGDVVVRVRSQVLFASLAPGQLVVDSALMDPVGDEVPAGTPLTLVLEAPTTEVVAAVVEATVTRWAASVEIVDLELRAREGGLRAVLSDGSSTVRLDLVAGGMLAA